MAKSRAAGKSLSSASDRIISQCRGEGGASAFTGKKIFVEVKLMGIERENCLIPLTALNELHFLWFMRSEPIISGFCEVLKNKMALAVDKGTSQEKAVCAGVKELPENRTSRQKDKNLVNQRCFWKQR